MKGRLSPVFVVVTLLGLNLVGCGGARETAKPKAVSANSAQNMPSAKLGGATPAFAAADRRGLLEKVAWVKSTPQPPLPNDGDHDEPGDEDKDNNHDTGTGQGSIDPYVDYLPPANNRAYHDEDDEQVVKFGHSASREDSQAVGTLVERYYAAAAANNGVKACSMLLPSLAKAVPVNYGKLGESYLHGGRTCAGVMTRLFTHFRRELAAPVRVTQVRVSGPTALAFIGSRSMRASQISLQRERGTWRIEQLISVPLS